MAMKVIQLIPLFAETRTAITTAEAAGQLNRAEQTLRAWHCKGTFPDGLRPAVVNGRLAWPVAGIRKALGVA